MRSSTGIVQPIGSWIITYRYLHDCLFLPLPSPGVSAGRFPLFLQLNVKVHSISGNKTGTAAAAQVVLLEEEGAL